MEHRLKMLILMICLFLAGALIIAGCGNSTGAPTTNAQSSAGAGTESSPAADDLEKSILNAEDKTPEEKSVAREALRYAEDSNTGSRFKASAIKVCDGWARVAVEQADVPAEEAVSFGVFLRKSDAGRWEVAETGTDITPDALPGAPLEIFKSD